MNRLRHLSTLRIRPEDEISINYRGKTYGGFEGDTIATLLFANGIRIFSRSIKYHRPRGLYSLEGECSNTFMQVDGIPNVCTENTPARSGMIVNAQNVVGSPEYDLMGFMDKLSWTMPAGTSSSPIPPSSCGIGAPRRCNSSTTVPPCFLCRSK